MPPTATDSMFDHQPGSPQAPGAARAEHANASGALSSPLIASAATWPFIAHLMAWGLIALGVAARVREFVFSRSLWIDEASAAISIASRDFAGLTRPLENSQTAPIGYIMLTEVADVLFGHGEMSLRLLPLLCGIATLLLFHRIASRLLQPAEGLVALSLAALLNWMVYFSNEFKPYSVDAAATAAILLCGLTIAQNRANWPRVVLLALVATVCVWVSFTATFIVAAVGLPLMIAYWRRGERGESTRIAMACGVAAVNFAANYMLFMRQLTGNPLMERVWSHLFMSIPPSPSWLVGRFVDFFTDPFGATFPGLAAAVLLLGVVYFWRHNRVLLAMALLPVFFTLAASALHLYPAGTRVLLFAMPLALLLVAGGLRLILNVRQEGKVIFAIITALLLLHPCVERLKGFKAPFEKEEIHPVLVRMAEHVQPGDTIYLYTNAHFHYDYYVTHAGLVPQLKPFTPVRGSNGRFNWHAYTDDLNRLRGKSRVWFVFAHIWKWSGVDEDRLFLHHLAQMGARPLPIDGTSPMPRGIGATGAAAYLFDLSQARPLTVPSLPSATLP